MRCALPHHHGWLDGWISSPAARRVADLNYYRRARRERGRELKAVPLELEKKKVLHPIILVSIQTQARTRGPGWTGAGREARERGGLSPLLPGGRRRRPRDARSRRLRPVVASTGPSVLGRVWLLAGAGPRVRCPLSPSLSRIFLTATDTASRRRWLLLTSRMGNLLFCHSKL